MYNSFRKIDIDTYDEYILQKSELYEVYPRDPAEVLEDAKQRAGMVGSLLAKNDVSGANVDDAKAAGIPGVIKSIVRHAGYADGVLSVQGHGEDGVIIYQWECFAGMARKANGSRWCRM